MASLEAQSFENPASQASTSAGERRGAARMAGCPPLHVAGMTAVVEDVSRRGIALKLRIPVPVGRRYLLRLSDALDGSTQEILAEVVWCRGGSAGLAWVDLRPDQDEWLGRRFQAWLAFLPGVSRR